MTDREIEERIRRGYMSREQMLRTIQDEINNGNLDISGIVRPILGQQTTYAGGTNFCPNSDFSFSREAWTVTPPVLAADNNKVLYQVYKQVPGANIGTELRTDEADAELPFWDLSNGTVNIGTTDVAKYRDIAIKMADVQVFPGSRWYLRAALATKDDTPMPDGTIFYMGFWAIKTDTTQGWLSGGTIVLSNRRIGAVGTTLTEYMLVGRLDTGYQVKSNTVLVANSPDVLNEINYMELNFTGSAGFTEVQLYRKRGGVTSLIADITNSAQLHHFDQGGSISTVPDFPVVSITALEAYGEGFPFVAPITTVKSFSDFTFNLPASFASADIASVYVRFGIKAVAAEARQLLVDTVWAGRTYNNWSPAPTDNPLRNAATTLVTTGVPSTPTTSEPPAPFDTCLLDSTDLLLPNGEWTEIGKVERGTQTESGDSKVINRIGNIRSSQVSEILVVKFTCGLEIRCTESHRFLRSLEDGTGCSGDSLKPGDEFLGMRDTGEFLQLTVESVTREYVGRTIVVSLKIRKNGKYTPYYAGGDRNLGIACFFHNRKPDEMIIVIA